MRSQTDLKLLPAEVMKFKAGTVRPKEGKTGSIGTLHHTWTGYDYSQAKEAGSRVSGGMMRVDSASGDYVM